MRGGLGGTLGCSLFDPTALPFAGLTSTPWAWWKANASLRDGRLGDLIAV